MAPQHVPSRTPKRGSDQTSEPRLRVEPQTLPGPDRPNESEVLRLAVWQGTPARLCSLLSYLRPAGGRPSVSGPRLHSGQASPGVQSVLERYLAVLSARTLSR